MTQLPTTMPPIDLINSGKPFIYLHQVRGVPCSAQGFRNAEEFITFTAAMASSMWSKNKNYDGQPLLVKDVSSAVGARLQMDMECSTFPLYIDQTGYESNVRWNSSGVVQEVAENIGMVRPVHQPKGLLAWLRSNYLRLLG